MVGVEVGQHDQWNPLDTQAAQAPVHRLRFRTRVHHDGGAAAGVEHEPVALADVAGDHHPLLSRPPRCRQRDQQRAHHQPAQSQRREPPGKQRAQEQRQCRADHREGADADGPAGQPKAATGRSAPRTATPMIHPAHHAAGVANRRPSGSATSPTTPPATRARSPDRRPEPRAVGADGDDAHLPRDRGDERGAGDLRGQGHGHRRSDRARQRAHQPVSPPGRQPEIPAVARTESAKPTVCANQGSKSSSRRTAAPSAERPGGELMADPDQADRAHGKPPGPCGLGPGQEHEADHPERPTTTSRPAFTPAQRASRSIEPTTRARLVL